MTQEAPVKAKLYTVTEPLDRPVAELIEEADACESEGGAQAITVDFNPSTLKVSLSNTLGENKKEGNSRAAQYIDKSSSSLTVELIFDTSDYDVDKPGGPDPNATDVRLRARKIARTFMKPEGPE